jgi:hypothetical protein
LMGSMVPRKQNDETLWHYETWFLETNLALNLCSMHGLWKVRHGIHMDCVDLWQGKWPFGACSETTPRQVNLQNTERLPPQTKYRTHDDYIEGKITLVFTGKSMGIPYIGLIYGRYLQFRILEWPLSKWLL